MVIYGRVHILSFEGNMMFLEPFKKSQNMFIHYQQLFCCTEMQNYLEKNINKIIFGACTALLTPNICKRYLVTCHYYMAKAKID